MFIRVRLLKGFQTPLWYEVPEILKNKKFDGTIVHVPFRRSSASAFVESMSLERPAISASLKLIHGIEEFPADIRYYNFIKQLSYYHRIDSLDLIRRMRTFFHQPEEKDKQQTYNSYTKSTVTLTKAQQIICDAVKPYIEQNQYYPVLLHGVTGSGKTEVYLDLILKTLEQKKSVIFLVPEVSLAVQMAHIFEQRLSKNLVFGFHSATNASAKRELWQNLLTSKPIVIVGVHLPVLLPIENLGLVIVDEEHEIGYQEKKHPRINSKEAIIWRAKLYNVPIILGSATPSVTSLYNVQKRDWQLFTLTERFGGSFPAIKQINLLNKKKRQNFWISRELEDAIRDRLQKNEQTILFLNRRGYSFFVQCKECSFMPRCGQCSVTLTLHENNNLLCHYCGHSQGFNDCCPACKASDSILKKGIGTQQLVAIVQKIFPSARIARADLDATVNKKKWQMTVNNMLDGSLDILIGTQSITKGYHFPKVTLVGIVWADLQINFPIYNAAEIALQQLIQVSGRAGRASTDSCVIAQTMSDHSIFSYINEERYIDFYEQELENRKNFQFPPFVRFAEIELRHADEQIVEAEAAQLREQLFNCKINEKIAVDILGPAKPLVSKIKNINSRKIYLKSVAMQPIIVLMNSIDKKTFVSSIYFVPSSS